MSIDIEGGYSVSWHGSLEGIDETELTKSEMSSLKEAVHEACVERCKYLINEGYVSGEIIEHIRIDSTKCPEDGWEFSGWATIQRL